MLEYFVHLDADRPPRDLVVAAARIPASVSPITVPTKQLPLHWQRTPAPATLREIGDTFIRKAAVAAMLVPSALASGESNWLLNPAHPDFRKLDLLPVEPLRCDPRFF